MTRQTHGDHVEDWRAAIATLIAIQQRIRDLDVDGVWSHDLPGVAATETVIGETEKKLGEQLDPRYRRFLSYANGWRAFLQWIDLFGTEECLGADMTNAQGHLEWLEERGGLAAIGSTSQDLFPIAMTRRAVEEEDVDLFVVTKPGRRDAGRVIWLARDEVDRFANFDSFFLAVLDYNRAEIDDLSKARGRVM